MVRTKIIVVTRGGIVETVLADLSPPQEIEVEVLDLDEPSYPTNQDIQEHAKIIRRHEEVCADPKFKETY